MENPEEQQISKRCRKNERGAALVTVLMISFLLIVAATARDWGVDRGGTRPGKTVWAEVVRPL